MLIPENFFLIVIQLLNFMIIFDWELLIFGCRVQIFCVFRHKNFFFRYSFIAQKYYANASYSILVLLCKSIVMRGQNVACIYDSNEAVWKILGRLLITNTAKLPPSQMNVHPPSQKKGPPFPVTNFSSNVIDITSEISRFFPRSLFFFFFK